MAKKQKLHPLSLRISKELNERLESCAKQIKIKKHTLGQLAIEAAVDAIEKNGGKLVIPIQFDVTQVPVEKRQSEDQEPKEGTG